MPLNTRKTIMNEVLVENCIDQWSAKKIQESFQTLLS